MGHLGRTVNDIIRDWKANGITMLQAVRELAQHNIDGWDLLPRV
jgi:hypothetical protein